MKLLSIFLVVLALAPTLAAARGDAELPDLGFLVMPESIDAYAAVPRVRELDEIVRVGARALDWVDLLQRDVPVNEREQVWRRVDRIGHEATPENPMFYNGDIVLETYRKTIAETPKAVADILQAEDVLPAAPPAGLSTKDVVAAIRPIHLVYSRASRWMALYEWRSSLGRGRRDLRGSLKLQRERDSLVDMTARWAQLSQDVRERFLAELAEACPLTLGQSVEHCRREHRAWIRDKSAGHKAELWLRDLLARGEREYASRFGVRERHPGARTQVHAGYHEVEVPAFGIDASTFAWIQERIQEAWVFKDIVGLKMFESSSPGGGSVRVVWEKGALPQVNGIAGDVITMDANTPKWLEHTQTTMRHEFGHVLGFADCYTEFWDDQLGAFTYYSLDPTDAMCALSGSYLERHRDALLKGYF